MKALVLSLDTFCDERNRKDVRFRKGIYKGSADWRRKRAKFRLTYFGVTDV